MTREREVIAGGGRRVRSEDEPALPAAAPADVALHLQRAYGNRLVARVLEGVTAGKVPGSGPDFRYGTADGGIEKEILGTATELDDAVKAVLDDYFDGVQSMFLQNTAVTTLNQWADAVFSHMDAFYAGDAFGRQEVKASVKRVKDENRQAALLHLADLFHFTATPEADDPVVYDGPSLRELLEKKGAYLEEADDVALQAIYDTEGKFAATEVDLGPGTRQLIDEDGYVVVIDDHQQKHQADLIPGFKTYTGERGNKFAIGKDLAWHQTHTALVVLQTMKDAVSSGQATKTGVLSPSKDAIDGINYDLAISYDAPTGKYVGVYHCNPYKDEYEQVYTGD